MKMVLVAKSILLRENQLASTVIIQSTNYTSTRWTLHICAMTPYRSIHIVCSSLYSRWTKIIVTTLLFTRYLRFTFALDFKRERKNPFLFDWHWLYASQVLCRAARNRSGSKFTIECVCISVSMYQTNQWIKKWRLC